MAKVRRHYGATSEGQPVKLFEVYNTSHNGLLVLARDFHTALEIAYSSNHLHRVGFIRKDSSYPHINEIQAPFGYLSEYWELIQIAVSRRLEGTIHLEKGGMSIGYHVIEV